ncbi:MAG: hypothetical protein ABIK28_16985 [Planctomycetota bacterium]
MLKSALALLAIACLLCALPIAESALIPGMAGEKKLIVGEKGLKLYPRFNKSLKPKADLTEGQELNVLREFKAWKQVQVGTSDLEGWILCEVQKDSAETGKKFDTVADPSTTGLVARGWSKDYAAHNGADFAKISDLKARELTPDRFEKFLQGEVNR